MMSFSKHLAGVVLTILAAAAARATPFYVDLRPVVDSGLTDDGVANNGQGGWTDEGINDMIVYPPIPSGIVVRNGYHFQLIDPTGNGGRSIVMLQGEARGTNYPREVTVTLPGVKGHYLYFLQNAAAAVRGAPANTVVARYTLHYADGTEATLPIREGVEIQQWWTGNWWDNSGAASWPIFVGRNVYSMKWSQYIGVWAMQWTNPSPDKVITSLTLTSAIKSIPAIFAVTVDDEDYFHSPDIKTDFKRPDGVPDGFFEKQMAIENRAIFNEMLKVGMVKGVRKAELIRPDLIAVTLDALVAQGVGQGETRAAALQKPETFLVSSATDARYATPVHPTRVGRQSENYWTGNIGTFPVNNVYWHTYYLQLPTPLQSGADYTFAVAGLPTGFAERITFPYRAGTTVTPAIKINQGAYSAKSHQRYAYLGWWAADLGAVDYAAFTNFQVSAAANDQAVLNGAVTLRAMTNGPSGEDVYEMDLSSISTTGRYYIAVPGLGRSDAFDIGGNGIHNLYVTTMRAFLGQRCGADLTPAVTDFPRPPCHLRNYANGHLVGDGPARTNEPIREFRGGYHDAGDCDVFYVHLLATEKTLIAYESCPTAFKDGDLRLPESGNGIPDLLDEAAWGLKFYADNQLPDGGILAGRANDEDYGAKEWKVEWAKEFGDLPPYGNFPSCNASANIFAAVAAHYARLVTPFDAKQGHDMLERARKAYAWALAHQTTKYEQDGISYGRVPWKRAWALAAATLFSTTGEPAYNETYMKLVHEGEAFKSDWKNGEQMPYIYWPYASCQRAETDPTAKKTARDAILKAAAGTVKNTQKWAYRMGTGRDVGGWGSLVGGGRYAGPCLLAWLLTHEQSYLDAASLNADFELGANPLSRSFITGVGSRPVEHPEVADWLYDRNGRPEPGIPVFGPGGDVRSLGGVYPTSVPIWRCWIDSRVDALHCEFGVESPIGDSAMLYSLLWTAESGN